MRKTLISLFMIFLLVAISLFGQAWADSEVVDFESFPVGTPSDDPSVSEMMTITGNSLVVVEEGDNGDTTLGFVAYNSDVNGPNGSGGENWLPGSNSKSLGNASTLRGPDSEDLMVEFDPDIIVTAFSLDIFDYGDWFPEGGSDFREAALTAYDFDNIAVGQDTISINYDRYQNDVYQAGALPLSVNGTDIAYVALTFDDLDPGITSDNFSIQYGYRNEVPLCAGQNEVVGSVILENDDGNNLKITYKTNEQWYIAETHLATSCSEAIPATKKGNPIPGQFPYSSEHDPFVQEVSHDISICCDPLIDIAAHAVVLGLQEPAPFAAGSVADFVQGIKKDGSPVDGNRSEPLQALAFETGQDPTNFYSLGFGSEEQESFITVQFDCPIVDRFGPDLQIIEDTWGGSYPLEQAEVWVSQDDETYTYLGLADNVNKINTENTATEFDLQGSGLDWIQYVMVIDATNPDIHNSSADGFDLNAVLSLQDCMNGETAWADGCEGARFNEKTTWATYFQYQPSCAP